MKIAFVVDLATFGRERIQGFRGLKPPDYHLALIIRAFLVVRGL